MVDLPGIASRVHTDVILGLYDHVRTSLSGIRGATPLAALTAHTHQRPWVAGLTLSRHWCFLDREHTTGSREAGVLGRGLRRGFEFHGGTGELDHGAVFGI